MPDLKSTWSNTSLIFLKSPQDQSHSLPAFYEGVDVRGTKKIAEDDTLLESGRTGFEIQVHPTPEPIVFPQRGTDREAGE